MLVKISRSTLFVIGIENLCQQQKENGRRNVVLSKASVQPTGQLQEQIIFAFLAQFPGGQQISVLFRTGGSSRPLRPSRRYQCKFGQVVHDLLKPVAILVGQPVVTLCEVRLCRRQLAVQ